MDIVKPAKLNIGDAIGIVSTSFPFPTDKQSSYYQKYLSGVKELEKMGFVVKEANNLGKTHWWTGGTPQEKADDINALFADPNIKAIISHDGGQGAYSVLPYLNYEVIAKNPKPFIGFSDVTNILVALYTRTGLVGFHMGLLTYELGGYWQERVPSQKDLGARYFRDILTTTNPIGNISPITEWQTWREGSASGKLFGGNLSMLASLVGTKYFPMLDDLRGNILFWEIDNVQSYRIERGLLQLKYAGVLDVISGMMIGKLVDIKPSIYEPMGQIEPTPQEIVMETLKDTSFPILSDVDFGHKMINLPMPIGINAVMDATAKKLELNEAAVI